MNSGFVLSVSLVFQLAVQSVAVASPAGAIATKDHLQSSTLQLANNMLDEIIAIAGRPIERPVLEMDAKSKYAIVSLSGTPARIVLTPTYLADTTGPALQFALAHELAHLHLAHHERLRRFREAGLASAQNEAHASSRHLIRSVYHAIELEADSLAMRWFRQVGGTPSDAAEALRIAYGGHFGATDTHPAFAERVQRLGD